MSNDCWKILCDRANDLIEIGVTDEGPFHNALEKVLKIAYKWPSEYIKHKPSLKIGVETKYPDIVLEGEGFGIIIEVKAPGVLLGDEQAGQLISYMNNYYTSRNSIKCKYGLLIGRGIKVYFQDDPNRKPELITSFGFDIDSKDGNSLSEILSYDVCSDEKLEEFMHAKIEEKRERKEKEQLEHNNDIMSPGNKGLGQPKPTQKSTENDYYSTISKFADKCIIIKIKPETVYSFNGDIYEAVRTCWRNSKTRAEEADYVLAVISGEVEEVYKPTEWYYVQKRRGGDRCNDKCPNLKNPCPRIGFDGVLADEDARKRYKGISIPWEPGMAAPVLFTY